MSDWTSPYGGLFRDFGPVTRFPHDPDVFVFAGSLVEGFPGQGSRDVGGVGWNEVDAKRATIGEAIERRSAPWPGTRGLLETSFERWNEREPAIEPDRWVLFGRDQSESPGFPFVPFTRSTITRWLRCRRYPEGDAIWAPEEMVSLDLGPGRSHRLAPGTSTGLVSGTCADQPLLRGLQEVIERDATVGAWMGSYPVEEHDPAQVLRFLGTSRTSRILRPNLTYRFYRIDNPWSEHVTMVTVEGPDLESQLWSVGSACRGTRLASWERSLLEALQGRHFVRFLVGEAREATSRPALPRSFAEHAAYYSLHPDELPRTVLARAKACDGSPPSGEEDLPLLAGRLGAGHPILYRLVTPRWVGPIDPGRLVLRVMVPGLRPLHGAHHLAHLGDSRGPRLTLQEWLAMPPHPFP